MSFVTHVLYSEQFICNYGNINPSIANNSEYKFLVPIRDTTGIRQHVVDIEPELIDFFEEHDFAFQPRINRIQLSISDADAVHIMLRFGDKVDIRKM